MVYTRAPVPLRALSPPLMRGLVRGCYVKLGFGGPGVDNLMSRGWPVGFSPRFDDFPHLVEFVRSRTSDVLRFGWGMRNSSSQISSLF
jgi:hypothetical protein